MAKQKKAKICTQLGQPRKDTWRIGPGRRQDFFETVHFKTTLPTFGLAISRTFYEKPYTMIGVRREATLGVAD